MIGIITGGKGDYQSALGEILSGEFHEGLLHGEKCFEKNINGVVKLGQFKHGELHGFGTVQTHFGDNFDGYFEQGLKHGRGVNRMADQGVYRGYYFNDMMHGKASLEYNIELDDELATSTNRPKMYQQPKASTQPKDDKNKNEPTSKYTAINGSGEYSKSPYSAIFQGYFLANNIANRGMTMTFAKQTPRIISRKDPRKLVAIGALLNAERQKVIQQARLQEKFSFMEQSIREEIITKKSRIFRQQRHLTKKMLYNDDVYGYDERFNNTDHQLRTKEVMRQERFNRIDENDEYANKKALVPRLRAINRSLVQTYTKAYERVQPEYDDRSDSLAQREQVNEDLIRYALVDFEEARERQRLLKYDLIWQRAEDAFIKSKSSNNESKL